MPSRESQRVAANWAGAASGARYASHRFRTSRAARRDPKLVDAILRDFGVRGRVLDVPCGAGRLRAMLAARDPGVVSVDVSAAMLARARAAGVDRLVNADVERLPFRDRGFDVVVCCRLLHHLREREQLERVVAELVRVSNRLVIASFWDRASWGRLRASVGKRERRGRTATSRAIIESCFENAGATAREFRGVFRFVSQQTFVVAERA